MKNRTRKLIPLAVAAGMLLLVLFLVTWGGMGAVLSQTHRLFLGCLRRFLCRGALFPAECAIDHAAVSTVALSAV